MKTPRLRLREWRETDAKDLYEAASDPELGPLCGWKPHRSLQESKTVLHEALMVPENYAIEHMESGRVIGSIGFKQPEASSIGGLTNGNLELGYWVGRTWWEQGYATEASEVLLRHAFRDMDAKSVWACCYEGNERSRHVMDKLGMDYRFSEFVAFPELRDAYMRNVCCITREEWEERQSAHRK